MFGLFLEVLIVLRFSQKPRIIHKDRTKIIVMLMCHRQIYYWYDSSNILGYPTEEDSIIKIADIKLANELLDVIYNNGEKLYEKLKK